MKFYLGTHEPSWLERVVVPLFVSRRRLERSYSRRWPRAVCDWSLDSGGFSELSLNGGWAIGARLYAERVRIYRDEIGRLDWCAPQDWMCEPDVVKKTGLSVLEHQRRTVDNFFELRDIAPDLPFVPVLQGWELDDYKRCADMYEARGLALNSEPVVGIGTVCRRQKTKQAVELVSEFYSAGLNLHGFGFKVTGLKNCGAMLESADSLAWSYGARRQPPMGGCSHKACNNCVRFALAWREKLLSNEMRMGR